MAAWLKGSVAQRERTCFASSPPSALCGSYVEMERNSPSYLLFARLLEMEACVLQGILATSRSVTSDHGRAGFAPISISPLANWRYR
jgi:hypothetical protein